MLRLTLICYLLTIGIGARSQPATGIPVDTAHIQFRDTVSNMVFDSTTHRLGLIPPNNDNNRVVKYFRYIGPEPITIVGTWTSDPHYICEVPKGPLLPNQIYSITICFWHEGRQGRMYKQMGLYLSNGNKVMLIFQGNYIPLGSPER